MRAYRSDGKTVAMLSVALPTTDEAGARGAAFNDFYTAVFERYGRACEKIKQSEGEGIIKISVDFNVICDADEEKLLTVKRTVTVKSKNTKNVSEATDVFDLSRGVFTR